MSWLQVLCPREQSISGSRDSCRQAICPKLLFVAVWHIQHVWCICAIHSAVLIFLFFYEGVIKRFCVFIAFTVSFFIQKGKPCSPRETININVQWIFLISLGFSVSSKYPINQMSWPQGSIRTESACRALLSTDVIERKMLSNEEPTGDWISFSHLSHAVSPPVIFSLTPKHQ